LNTLLRSRTLPTGCAACTTLQHLYGSPPTFLQALHWTTTRCHYLPATPPLVGLPTHPPRHLSWFATCTPATSRANAAAYRCIPAQAREHLNGALHHYAAQSAWHAAVWFARYPQHAAPLPAGSSFWFGTTLPVTLATYRTRATTASAHGSRLCGSAAYTVALRFELSWFAPPRGSAHGCTAVYYCYRAMLLPAPLHGSPLACAHLIPLHALRRCRDIPGSPATCRRLPSPASPLRAFSLPRARLCHSGHLLAACHSMPRTTLIYAPQVLPAPLQFSLHQLRWIAHYPPGGCDAAGLRTPATSRSYLVSHRATHGCETLLLLRSIASFFLVAARAPRAFRAQHCNAARYSTLRLTFTRSPGMPLLTVKAPRTLLVHRALGLVGLPHLTHLCGAGSRRAPRCAADSTLPALTYPILLPAALHGLPRRLRRSLPPACPWCRLYRAPRAHTPFTAGRSLAVPRAAAALLICYSGYLYRLDALYASLDV